MAGKPCSVALALNEFSPEDRAKFDAWMKTDSGVSNIEIWHRLYQAGYKVGSQTVGRHRRGRGECRCLVEAVAK